MTVVPDSRIRKLRCLCLSVLLDHYDFADVLCRGQQIVDIIFCPDFFWNMSIQQQSAALFYAVDKLDTTIAQNFVCTYVSRENVNFIFSRQKHRGQSLALHLMRTVSGREILMTYNCYIAGLIVGASINNVVPESSSLRGESVALHLALALEGQGLLLSEACHLADQLDAQTLNHIVGEYHPRYAGLSVASALASTALGRIFLRQNGNRLSRMLSVDVLNSHISAPGKALDGCSVAFVLLHYGRVSEYPDIVPKLSSLTINFVHPPTSPFAGQSVAFLLSDVSLSFLYRLWTPMLTSDCLNAVVSTGLYRDMSVACRLARYDVALFTLDDYKLTRMLSAEAVEAVNSSNRSFESIIYWLCAADEQGVSLLALDDYRIARMMTGRVLNSIVNIEKTKNESVAYKLVAAGGPVGMSIFCMDDFRVARMLHRDALNAVVGTDSNAGESLALHLVSDVPLIVDPLECEDEGAVTEDRCSLGWSVLELNKCRLGRLISEEVLSVIVSSPPRQGQSVAFWLAVAMSRYTHTMHDHCVSSLLTYDDCRLGLSISSNAMNEICNVSGQQERVGVECRDRLGESTAFWLCSSDVGLDLMTLDNYALTRLINSSSLNYIIRSPKHKGQSVWSKLKSSEKGLRILAADSNRLESEISSYTRLLDSGNKAARVTTDYFFSLLWVKWAIASYFSNFGALGGGLIALGITLMLFMDIFVIKNLYDKLRLWKESMLNS
jgi:hypothetical protein